MQSFVCLAILKWDDSNSFVYILNIYGGCYYFNNHSFRFAVHVNFFCC